MTPSESATLRPPASRRVPRATVLGALAFAVVFAAGETYAKWWPYAHKVASSVASGSVGGSSILAKAGAPGAAPSWHDAWSFTVSYGLDIWIALGAAILIGAGVEVLLPRRALGRLFSHDGPWASSAAGGALALPCLMCTCCASPITVSLRRSGVPVGGALSYWLANPLLNPVVLVLLAIALPWPYVVVRICVGAALVFGAAPFVARLAPRADVTPHDVVRAQRGPWGPLGERATSAGTRPGLVAYGVAVGRLAAWLVPEYFVVVLALGAFAGWLLPLGHAAATWGLGAVAVAALAGTILVLPTGGEIPVILGLVAIGMPAAVTGALVIALPAVSLASMAMVGRWLSWRVTLATAGVVALGALAAGALVATL